MGRMVIVVAFVIGAAIGYAFGRARQQAATAAVALEAEVSLLRDFQTRCALSTDALVHVTSALCNHQEVNSRLTAELTAERENLAALRLALLDSHSGSQNCTSQGAAHTRQVIELG
jgi:hypothetical protein